jgi:hypothetical protein
MMAGICGRGPASLAVLKLAAVGGLAAALALTAPSTAGTQEPPPAFEPTLDEIDDLPAGPGQEETFYTCTACHGLALIKSQGMTSERWDDTISFMIGTHNMPEPTAEERDLIVSYLAEHFPPRQEQRGWQNPFLKGQ